jgi:N-acyl-phosphatidylethanolamine-hydrolysing phospholipase D
MSSMHASPADAVRIFRDVRAKKALAMPCIGGKSLTLDASTLQLNSRYRTWVLTLEPVLEPFALLRKECEKVGVGPDEFMVPALGETVIF